MRWLAFIVAACLPAVAAAGSLTATRTLPAGAIIGPGDVTLSDKDGRGLTDTEQAIGMQARITIYAGRVIHASALQAPKLVERNQVVRMAYARGALHIEADGRAMSPGGAGDIIRVMNTTSRNIVSALINPDGSLTVLN